MHPRIGRELVDEGFAGGVDLDLDAAGDEEADGRHDLTVVADDRNLPWSADGRFWWALGAWDHRPDRVPRSSLMQMTEPRQPRRSR